MRNNLLLLIMVSFLLGTLAYLATTQETIPTNTTVLPADIQQSKPTSDKSSQSQLYALP